LVADQVGEAEVDATLEQDAHHTVQKNALIEENTDAGVSNNEAGLFEHDSEEVTQLEVEVTESRQKAIELATNLDNANQAAADAAQSAEAAKAAGEAARAEQDDIKAQAAQIEHDARDAYNQTLTKIAENDQQVKELEAQLVMSKANADKANEAARCNLDFNFTMMGIKASGLHKKDMSEGLREGLGQLLGAQPDDVTIDYMGRARHSMQFRYARRCSLTSTW